jgi:HEAT repeat protein
MMTASSLVARSIPSIVLAISLGCASALGQPSPPPAGTGTGGQPASAAADSEAVQTSAETPAETAKRCWQLLTESVQDAKHTETRTQALDALSSLGGMARADELIAAAMKDPNLDVRTAAVLAAGKSRSRSLVEPLRKLLGDPEPQVVFAAATTLWKQFEDRSGADILEAIAAGGRKANPTLIHGAKNDINRTLHSPGALEKIGIQAGAGFVLGPFGFAMDAVEYARKNGGNSARVEAIDLLAEDKSGEVRDQMKSALDDNDAGVRAAALRALGSFHRREDAGAIAVLLDDAKRPVRLAAAAAYIDCVSGRANARAARR